MISILPILRKIIGKTLTGIGLQKIPKERSFQGTLHGFQAILNEGNQYPAIASGTPLFNACLVEVVHWLSGKLKRPIHLIDVGAAYGDTVLLLEQRCAGLVESYLCIDGNDAFFQLLELNTQKFNHVKRKKTLLAASIKNIPTMVHIHGGTAACLGIEQVQATTLDKVVGESGQKFDILKIDVDGFDGEVIAGSAILLDSQKPLVLFEWHPCLWEKAGNDLLAPFETLRRLGYKDLLWFDNAGDFSHFGTTECIENIAKLSQHLKRVNHIRDRHCDILALPQKCPNGYEEISLLLYARDAEKRFPVI